MQAWNTVVLKDTTPWETCQRASSLCGSQDKLDGLQGVICTSMNNEEIAADDPKAPELSEELPCAPKQTFPKSMVFLRFLSRKHCSPTESGIRTNSGIAPGRVGEKFHIRRPDSLVPGATRFVWARPPTRR